MANLRTLSFCALVLTAASVASATSFQIAFNHTGATFLDEWTFINGTDVTNKGNVLFQTREDAVTKNLTFLNSDGNYVVKVDNVTSAVGDDQFGRDSVMVWSNYTISEGNLVIMDAVHIPFGCSVWPAFWMEGPNWPNGGEIDIIEGVNQDTFNSVSLHTLNGCKHPDNTTSSTIETGNLFATDCFNQTADNTGCLVQVPGSSYGTSFNQNGGGVYAMNWNTSGVFIWFFPRSSIPSDVAGDSPNPDGWGLPVAAYPASSCDFSTFFTPQTLILEIDICGNFALNVFAQTCASVASSCLDLVQEASNYNDAYWEMKYIRVFAQEGSAVASSDSAQAASATGTGSPQASTTSGGRPALVATSRRQLTLSGFVLLFVGILLGCL